MNPLVRTVLRSPFHSLLDGSLIGVSYTGRRSGRRFSLVTQYAQSGSQLIVVVGEPERKNWWRNFREQASAEVLLRGQRLPCTAQIPSKDYSTRVPELLAYCSRFPRAASLHGLKPGKDGKFSDEEVARAAEDTVMVVFELPNRNGG
jgi:hypothetical protein